MKYTKTINGKIIIKEGKRIVIYKDDLQIINPSHDMLIEDGWKVHEDSFPTEENTLKHAKEDLRNSITEYDLSSEVNAFYMGDSVLWLDKATRAGLMLRFQAEQALGRTETTLWYGSMMFTLPIEIAFGMLYALEVYASECYDNTQRHLANVDKLNSVEEIDAYDFTTGYPKKLQF